MGISLPFETQNTIENGSKTGVKAKQNGYEAIFNVWNQTPFIVIFCCMCRSALGLIFVRDIMSLRK